VKIADSFDEIAMYLCICSQMINSVIEERQQNEQNADWVKDELIPFQFDICILPKAAPKSSAMDEYEFPSDDDDDDDSDDDSEDEPETGYGVVGGATSDTVGSIKPRLDHFGIKYATPDVNVKKKDFITKRDMKALFHKVRKGRNGRYVMVVDRRGGDEEDGDDEDAEDDDDVGDEKKDDASSAKKNTDRVWLYSPKCEDDINYHSLAANCMEESLLFKTKKCLIPGIQKVNDPHFGADYPNAITLSFHVLSVEQIKCYLYINGCGMRFAKEDLKNVLPLYFENGMRETSKIRTALNEVWTLELKDPKFEAWYKATTAK